MYESCHAKLTTKWSHGSVVIWSCFWVGGFGPDGPENQDVYIDILVKNLHPWFKKPVDEEEWYFIFQEDNTSCHNGGYTKWWKETHEIRGFEHWPARSPDLSPTEHILRALEKLINGQRAIINSIDDLKKVLNDQWKNISVGHVHRLVASMSGRCQAVIEAKGRPTKYWNKYENILLLK